MSGLYIISDPDQKINGFYKVAVTSNTNNTITQYNVYRAKKDAELIFFLSCTDPNRALEIVKTSYKNKFISNTDWINIGIGADIDKFKSTVETLIKISESN